MANLVRMHIKLIIMFVFKCKFLTIVYMSFYNINKNISAVTERLNNRRIFPSLLKLNNRAKLYLSIRRYLGTYVQRDMLYVSLSRDVGISKYTESSMMMFFQWRICNLDLVADRTIWRVHKHFTERKASIPLGLGGLIRKGFLGMNNVDVINDFRILSPLARFSKLLSFIPEI